MYKIYRRGGWGGVQKSFTRTDPLLVSRIFLKLLMEVSGHNVHILSYLRVTINMGNEIRLEYHNYEIIPLESKTAFEVVNLFPCLMGQRRFTFCFKNLLM